MASAKKVMVSTRTQLCESTEHWVRQGQPQTRLEGGQGHITRNPGLGTKCGAALWMDVGGEGVQVSSALPQGDPTTLPPEHSALV